MIPFGSVEQSGRSEPYPKLFASVHRSEQTPVLMRRQSSLVAL